MKTELTMAFGLLLLSATGADAISLGAVNTQPVTLTGVVKYVRPGPPAYVQLLVADGQGGVQEWELEGPSSAVPAALAKQALAVKNLAPATIVIHPLSDNHLGGEIVSISSPAVTSSAVQISN